MLECLALILLAGCDTGLGLSDDGRPRQTLSLSVLDLDSTSTYFESGSNDLFESADQVLISSQQRVISGRLSSSSDVDVYNLGPASVGDRIVVEMAFNETLDSAIALFDSSGNSLLINDHRNVYLGQKTPFVDVVAQRPMEACYVVVSTTPGYRANGDYALVASKLPTNVPPQPQPDTVLLVFEGGTGIKIGGRPGVDVPIFDAANVDIKYAGQTTALIEAIVAGVRADYAGLDITVLSTSEGARADGSMSRLFFGTFDPALLGVAEGVDEFNATRSQEAIVFTDTFAAFMQLDPSMAELGQAMANVASHEIGHLLGLIHTEDDQGIMDVTASLNDLLRDQTFRRSPIYSAVFPIGFQDAVQSLLETIGGDPLLSILKYLEQPVSSKRSTDGDDEMPLREELYISTCGLDPH